MFSCIYLTNAEPITIPFAPVLAIFFASPVIKLSITITLSASVMIFSIRFEPIKPAPPVIK